MLDFFKIFLILEGTGIIAIPKIKELKYLTNNQNSVFVGTIKSVFRNLQVIKSNIPEYFHLISKLDRWPIRVHRVSTLSELKKVLYFYLIYAKSNKYQCYFRGQTSEYYDEENCISIIPSGVRGEYKHEYFLTDSEKLNILLKNWYPVIDEFFKSKIKTNLIQSLAISQGVPEALKVFRNFPPIRIVKNPYFLAIAMHYGFPTPSLDITPNFDTALWFSINKLNKEQEKYFYTITPDITKSVIYIYYHIDLLGCFALNLQDIKLMKNIATRPFVQLASAFPFINYEAPLLGDIDARNFYLQNSTWRYPLACIKFSNSTILSEFGELRCQNFYFPLDDPLYLQLKKNKLSGLALYD